MEKPKPTSFKPNTRPGHSKKPNMNSRPRERRPAQKPQNLWWSVIYGTTEMLLEAPTEIDVVEIAARLMGGIPDRVDKAKLAVFIVESEEFEETEIRAASVSHARDIYKAQYPHRVVYMVTKKPYEAPAHLTDRPFRGLNKLLKGTK